MAVTIVHIKKRKVGRRADMSPAKIVTKATEQFRRYGPEKFTLALVAKALHVGTTTIHHHFAGGIDELKLEIARSFLETLAPPYLPAQTTDDYLRRLFISTTTTFRKNPRIAQLIASSLANDPFLSPTFAERLMATVRGLTNADSHGWAFYLTIERICGLILVAGSDWTTAPKEAKARIQARLTALPASEFQALRKAAAAVAAEPLRRSHPQYMTSSANNAVASLLNEFGMGPPTV